MSLVKNVSGGPLDVPLLGRVVEDGETVEVPDYQDDGESPIVWPGNRWQPIGLQVAPENPANASENTGESAGEAE